MRRAVALLALVAACGETLSNEPGEAPDAGSGDAAADAVRDAASDDVVVDADAGACSTGTRVRLCRAFVGGGAARVEPFELSAATNGAVFLSGTKGRSALLAEFAADGAPASLVVQPDATGRGVTNAPEPYWAFSYQGGIVFDGGVFGEGADGGGDHETLVTWPAGGRAHRIAGERSWGWYLARAGTSGAYVVGSWLNRLEMLGDSYRESGRHLFAAKVFAGGPESVVVELGGGPQVARSAASDGAYQLYAAGRIVGELPGAPTPDGGTTDTDADAFVTCFATDLTRRWALRFAGLNVEATAVAGVQAGGVVVAGHFDSDVRGPDGSQLGRPSRGRRDAFVARVAANGALRWFVTFGGNADDVVTSVAFDPLRRRVVVAGHTKSPIIDLGPTQIVNETVGSDVAYLVALTQDGDVLESMSFRRGQQEGGPVAVDGAGRVYFAGTFHERLAVAGASLDAPAKGSDVFLMRWDN